MQGTEESQSVHTMEIRKEVFIEAPAAVAFEALLAELGPGSEGPDGKPFPMKLEAWPGGRWFRDLGETGGRPYGHLWAHVQVIKAPVLLELFGPMMMSYPGTNHVQYRLTPEGSGVRLTLVHRAMGTIPAEHRDGMPRGWEHGMNRIRLVAERAAARGK